MSFTPDELAHAISARMPGFEIDYEVDAARRAIADSWPRTRDDSAARAEWGWQPELDLAAMCDGMLEKMREAAKTARAE